MQPRSDIVGLYLYLRGGSKVSKVEVMSLPRVSANFPVLEEPQIRRENVLDVLETMLSGEVEMVVIEGTDGAGKTNILAQFAQKHADKTISLFLPSASRWALDTGMLRLDICNQISWILHKEEMPIISDASETTLRTNLFALRRLTQKLRAHFYFILDGIDQLPEALLQEARLALEQLPTGIPSFRFLISARPDQTIQVVPPGVRYKPWALPGFSLDEALHFFVDTNVDRDDLREFVRICRGAPGHLASFKRLIRSGYDSRQVMDNIVDKLPNLFELEWVNVDLSDVNLAKFLAVLAYDDRPHTRQSIRKLLGIDSAVILRWLAALTFIEENSKTGNLQYVSISFKGFAARQLLSWKAEAQSLIIDWLLSHQDEDEALIYLPAHLHTSGRLDELITYLSPEKLIRLLERAQSLLPLKEKIRLGIKAARRTKRDADLVRFSLGCAIVLGFESAEAWRSEVEARLALADYDSSLMLAQGTLAKEDRLHLLAIIAKFKHQQGTTPEAALIDQIRQLFDQINPAILGFHAIEIAVDVLPVIPQLAIELVERSTDVTAGENALDWALASLSLLSMDKEGGYPRTSRSGLESVAAKIRDPEVQAINRAVSALASDNSARGILLAMEGIKRAGDKLYLLRQWAEANRKRSDALIVVDYGLDLLIKTTAYSPTVSVLSDLAAPLPHSGDLEEVRRLIGLMDIQKAVLKSAGPTVAIIELELRIAEAEIQYAEESARNRLVNIYCDIQNIYDISTKLNCLARLTTALSRLDSRYGIEATEGLCSLSRDDFGEAFDALIASSADHLSALQPIIEVIAPFDLEGAVQLASRLNTEERRDLALAFAIGKSEHALGTESQHSALLLRTIESIKGLGTRDLAIQHGIKGLRRIAKGKKPDVSILKEWTDLVQTVREPELRCRACCDTLKLLSNVPEKFEEGRRALLNCLGKAWEGIDASWRRVDTAFGIARSLATSEREVAVEYLEKAEQCKADSAIESEIGAETYISCLDLAIRVLFGLLPKRCEEEIDCLRLKELIAVIPSLAVRIRLFATMALNFCRAERLNECKAIVTESVRPLLSLLEKSDRAGYVESFIESSPALYCAHRASTLRDIAKLAVEESDRALTNIIRWILKKCDPYEPYAEERREFDLSFDECLEICEIIALLEDDAAIFHSARAIAESITSRRGAQQFSRQQILEVARIIERIADEKLPIKRNISHEGYKIAVKAAVLRLQKAGLHEWETLVVAAKQIPNFADMAVTLSIVAEGLGAKDLKRGREVMDEVGAVVRDHVPAVIDKIDLYSSMASICLRTGFPNSKNL
jgi:NACHT domain-containing protein